MPAPTEVNEISCPEEQKLPGAAVGTVVPPADERERRAGGAASEADSVMPSCAAQPGLAKPEPAAGQELAVHPVPLSSPVGAVEAVRRAIDDATAGLQGGNGASVSLVLRPDANIQLALHVKLQQGHIEALAVLEHGDFAALGAGWTQLQTRLAEQGVRLAPLVPGSDRSMSSLGGESHGPRQDRQPEHWRPATEDLNKVAATRTGASKLRRPEQVFLRSTRMVGLTCAVNLKLKSNPMAVALDTSSTPMIASAGLNSSAQSAQLPEQTLSQSDFLQLLVTQLSSQDPMNPVSDAQFIGQMAQFSTLEETQTMQESVAGLQASNLLGQTIQVQNTSGKTDTGAVRLGSLRLGFSGGHCQWPALHP